MSLGPGKKTKAWDAARRKLKPRFEAAGITRCEFGYDGCWRFNGLSFAHAKKRNDLLPGELGVVALGCLSCHTLLERLPKVEMYKRVMEVINNRPVQP